MGLGLGYLQTGPFLDHLAVIIISLQAGREPFEYSVALLHRASQGNLTVFLNAVSHLICYIIFITYKQGQDRLTSLEDQGQPLHYAKVVMGRWK